VPVCSGQWHLVTWLCVCCRELDLRDLPYKAEEIPDYNKRKQRATILDEHISASIPYGDQQVAALNAEQQFYPFDLTGNTVSRPFCLTNLWWL